MTLWPAIIQPYPQGSCMTNLLKCAEPLLCVSLCSRSEMHKEKEDQHTYLRRASTVQSSITEMEHSNTAQCHTSMFHVVQWFPNPLAWQKLVAVPKPPSWRFWFSEPEEKPRICIFNQLPGEFTDGHLRPLYWFWGLTVKNPKESSLVALYSHSLQLLSIPSLLKLAPRCMSVWFYSS